MVVSLVAGVVLGLSAGFSPGPLFTFVISQTLKHGIKEGMKVAFAPLVTDLPIVIITLLLLTRLSNLKMVLGPISLLGGLFVLYLAYESFRTKEFEMSIRNANVQSLGKGVMVNVLNPHPYLFWLTVGAPMMTKSWGESPLVALAFVTVFYGCLVGSKVFLAVLVDKSRLLLIGKSYRYLMRILGVLLLIFSFLLFREGFRLLGL